MYFFKVFLLHDDIIIPIPSFDNPSYISFCWIQCVPLNLSLLLFEIFIVDQLVCTDFLYSLGL